MSRGNERRRPIQIRVLVLTGCLLALAMALSVADARIYRYQRPDGVWVFTDDPWELPPDVRPPTAQGAGGAPAPPRDVTGRLERALKPGGPVARAVLATVAIESPVGRGTGFFISPDGFILTNRHVLRTPAAMRRERAERHRQLTERAAAVEERLDAEQARIDGALADLERNRSRLVAGSYAYRLQEIRRWQADLDRRRDSFDTDVEDLQQRYADAESRDRRSDLERTFAIRLSDNTPLEAYLVRVDDTLDLALLKLDGYRTPHLEVADAQGTDVGGPVYAIGNPAALRNSVSKGVLSGYEGGLIKTDAKVYPGNSGGPLVDAAGAVLGINTFKELTRRFEGLGFAIPIRRALTAFAGDLPRRGEPASDRR